MTGRYARFTITGPGFQPLPSGRVGAWEAALSDCALPTPAHVLRDR